MSMQMTRTTSATLSQKPQTMASYPLRYDAEEQVYELMHPQREMVQKDFAQLKTAQQRLQKQSTHAPLSQTQEQRLKTIGALVEQLSLIVPNMQKSHEITEQQLQTIRQASDLSNQLDIEKRLKIAKIKKEQMATYPVEYDYDEQMYTLIQPQRELLRQQFQQIQAARKVLQKQSEKTALNQPQRERLQVLNTLIEQTSGIIDNLESTHTVPEHQWETLQQMRALSKQLTEEKIAKKSASKQGVSAVSSVVAASGLGDPPDDGNGDPHSSKHTEPRTRWTVLKDYTKRYFTKGPFLTHIVVGTGVGAILAIGSPVMVVTVPASIGVLMTLGLGIGALSAATQDPNGKEIDKLYQIWKEQDKVGLFSWIKSKMQTLPADVKKEIALQHTGAADK